MTALKIALVVLLGIAVACRIAVRVLGRKK